MSNMPVTHWHVAPISDKFDMMGDKCHLIIVGFELFSEQNCTVVYFLLFSPIGNMGNDLSFITLMCALTVQ